MISFLTYFGHGRALEGFLGIFKLVLAAYITTTGISYRVPALADFSWIYPSVTIATPFILIGCLQITGLLLNVRGVEWSWLLRFVGAGFAMFVWLALIIKTLYLGEPSLIVPLAVTCLPASAFLMYKAWNRLPVPGAVGLI
jgi:hypothetical protein